MFKLAYSTTRSRELALAQLWSDSALNQQEMNIDEYLNFSALEELWLLA